MTFQQFQSSEDIRSEPSTYQDVLIRQLDRIGRQLSDSVRSNNKYSILALEASIRYMDCLISFRARKYYPDEKKKIEAKLNPLILGVKEQRFDYVRDNLLKWIELEVKQLPSFGLMPDIPETLHMGLDTQEDGPVKEGPTKGV